MWQLKAKFKQNQVYAAWANCKMHLASETRNAKCTPGEITQKNKTKCKQKLLQINFDSQANEWRYCCARHKQQEWRAFVTSVRKQYMWNESKSKARGKKKKWELNTSYLHANLYQQNDPRNNTFALLAHVAGAQGRALKRRKQSSHGSAGNPRACPPARRSASSEKW